MLESHETDLDEAVALCGLRSDTLYRQLLKFEDERRQVHPSLVPQKQRTLERAVQHNPLAAAIVQRRPLHCEHGLLAGRAFVGLPVTCFGVHEVLLRTRFHRDFADGGSPGMLMLGEEHVTHDQLLGWYQELVPNVNLHRVYDRSMWLEKPAVAPLLAGAMTGALVAADADPGQWLFVVGAGLLGAMACGLVLYSVNRSRYGRQLHQTAPWNSSLYVDINLALLRDHPAELHLGCRARIPRPHLAGWKLKSQYYPLARQVIDGTYLATLPADKPSRKSA